MLSKTDSERDFADLPRRRRWSRSAARASSIAARTRSCRSSTSSPRSRRGHKMVIGVGGGTRVRHTISIALDLGLPTGGVAQLVGAMEELNAVLLNALLAPHGSMPMQREHFWELPLYFETGITPIVISMPPYHFWEPPPDEGRLPMHGSDFGLFQLAEVLGMKQVDLRQGRGRPLRQGSEEARRRQADPARSRSTSCSTNMPDGEHPRRASCSDAWHDAKHLERVQIVNGLGRGQLTRALAGEDVGTVITKEARREPSAAPSRRRSPARR